MPFIACDDPFLSIIALCHSLRCAIHRVVPFHCSSGVGKKYLGALMSGLRSMADRIAALRSMAEGDTPRLSTPKKSKPGPGLTPQRQGCRAPSQRATPTKVSPLQQARGEFNKTHRRLAIAMLIDTQAQDLASTSWAWTTLACLPAQCHAAVECFLQRYPPSRAMLQVE